MRPAQEEMKWLVETVGHERQRAAAAAGAAATAAASSNLHHHQRQQQLKPQQQQQQQQQRHRRQQRQREAAAAAGSSGGRGPRTKAVLVLQPLHEALCPVQAAQLHSQHAARAIPCGYGWTDGWRWAGAGQAGCWGGSGRAAEGAPGKWVPGWHACMCWPGASTEGRRGPGHQPGPRRAAPCALLQTRTLTIGTSTHRPHPHPSHLGWPGAAAARAAGASAGRGSTRGRPAPPAAPQSTAGGGGGSRVSAATNGRCWAAEGAASLHVCVLPPCRVQAKHIVMRCSGSGWPLPAGAGWLVAAPVRVRCAPACAAPEWACAGTARWPLSGPWWGLGWRACEVVEG